MSELEKPKQWRIFKTMCCTVVFALILHNIAPLSSMNALSATKEEAIPVKTKPKGPMTLDSACNTFLLSGDVHQQHPSASSVWHSFRENILNASFFPEYVANETAFRTWVNNLFEYHQESKLRKTSVNDANSNTVRKILEIVDRRLKYLQKKEGARVAEPLSILVLGGSVTMGFNCTANPLGLKMKNNCAWPIRLENMFNEGIFGGKKVVKITNVAIGGFSSGVAAPVVQYQLFPNHEVPHVIMSAFAPNDVQQPDIEKVFFEEVQDFLQHAKNVHPCEKDLPLIVIADHMYRPTSSWESQLRLSGYYAALAAWYDVMAFNHGNLARHHMVANFNNESKIEQLAGNYFNLHLGAGFHIGMAWTALFNFLKTFVDNCNDFSMLPNPMSSTAADNLKLQSNVSTINNRIDDLFPTPAVKHLSKLTQKGSLQDTLDQWKQRDHEAKSRCSTIAKSTLEDIICSHAWIVGPATGVNSQKELKKVMNPVLKSSNGWNVKGDPFKKPRVGYYAEKEGANFTMHFPITQLPMNVLTIFSMKSYGKIWRASRMEIKITIQHPVGGRAPDTATHEIKGFHKITTSVHFPHKFQLPGNGTSVGDTVILDAKLISGSMFKINGILLCRY